MHLFKFYTIKNEKILNLECFDNSESKTAICNSKKLKQLKR